MKKNPAGRKARREKMVEAQEPSDTKRWKVIALAALTGMVVGGVTFFAAESVRANVQKRAEISRVVHGRPGPWGDLQYTRLAIEPPEEYISADASREYQPVRWFFRQHTRAQVTELFQSAGLSPDQHEALFKKAGWEESPGGVTVIPDRDLVLGLEAKSRQAIYGILAHYKENLHQTQPFSYRPDLLEERLENSGLSEKSLADFRRLLYPQGRFLCLADATAYASTIGDAKERMRFIRTVSRRNTLLVKLRVTPETDIDRLEKYWNYDGNNREIRPLFESLARVPGGCQIDVTHLLPPFARKRLYSFPRPDEGAMTAQRNCHWTALNFFNDPPDDRFCDTRTVKQVLDSDYVKVEGEDRKLGDVLVLFHHGGDAIHSAVYVADDLVFTKNGGANTQPWIYMRLQSMLDYYAATCPPENPPQMVTLRRKGR